MSPISKNEIKLIKSLNIKKFRKKENLFFCEGIKIFKSLLSSDFTIKKVYGTDKFHKQFAQEIKQINFSTVTEIDLKKISALSSPQQVLCLVETKNTDIEQIDFYKELIIVLDKIQDPGNLGTIIRIADWFGIKNIICSEDSVDLYNPKTIQATMGSLFSENIFYENLKLLLSSLNKNIPVYGTFMSGANIYSKKLSANGLIVMGNEANGISQELKNFITEKISIPDFNKHKTAESLNIAIATAITCSEFKRR